MDAQLRSRAEERLRAAATAQGLADPRPPYRERLRLLRESGTAAFDAAISHYETVVLPALATADALQTWTVYGGYLGGLTGEGRLMAIDASGRAAPWEPPVQTGALILFIPQDTAADVLVALQPLAPTAAQTATLDLLVNRRLALG
jgi:hypothetical protein